MFSVWRFSIGELHLQAICEAYASATAQGMKQNAAPQERGHASYMAETKQEHHVRVNMLTVQVTLQAQHRFVMTLGGMYQLTSGQAPRRHPMRHDVPHHAATSQQTKKKLGP